ncbi:MAG: DUF2812 domain-containing protein [Thermaerobacter sp.]|nr:DUF2812 domain-containing protein [Thermaerobacter sp.]
MNRSTAIRPNLWLVWDYQKEKRRLEKLSQAGWHFEKMYLFYAVFSSNPLARYVYRPDYRPGLKQKEEFQNYVDLFQDAGWQSQSTLKGWRYFRRTWSGRGDYALSHLLATALPTHSAPLGERPGRGNPLFSPTYSLPGPGIRLPILGIWGSILLFLSYGYLNTRRNAHGMQRRS